MTEKLLRYVKQSQYQKIEHDLVVTRQGEMAYRMMETMVRGMIARANGLSAVIFEGLISGPGAALSIDLTAPAVAVQKLSNGDVRYCLDSNAGAAFNVILDPADAVNPRLDIIEAQFGLRDKYLDDSVDIADPATSLITTVSRYRDNEVYLKLQKSTGTPAGVPVPSSPTAGTAGALLGTVLTDILDLTTNYILSIAVGDDVDFVDVDCRGAVPAATTRAERIAAINGAGFGVIATNVGGAIKITAPGTGETSVVKIKQPNAFTNDGYAVILGGTITNGYVNIYRGNNAWFKIAEIYVPALAVVLNAGNVRSREEKSTWSADAATILNFQAFDEFYLNDYTPAIASKVAKAGDTMAGQLNMGGFILSDPLDPAAGNHVGDRDYNDNRYGYGTYDQIVSSQAQFNALFERTSANNYRILDGIKSILLLGGGGSGVLDGNRLITGGSYLISGILSGGDLPANGPIVNTNNCAIIQGTKDAVIDWGSCTSATQSIVVGRPDFIMKDLRIVGDAEVPSVRGTTPYTSYVNPTVDTPNFILFTNTYTQPTGVCPYNGLMDNVVFQGIGAQTLIKGSHTDSGITNNKSTRMINCQIVGCTSSATNSHFIIARDCEIVGLKSILNGMNLNQSSGSKEAKLLFDCHRVSDLFSYYDFYDITTSRRIVAFDGCTNMSNICIKYFMAGAVVISSGIGGGTLIFSLCNNISNVFLSNIGNTVGFDVTSGSSIVGIAIKYLCDK